jgi:hypothetical protein
VSAPLPNEPACLSACLTGWLADCVTGLACVSIKVGSLTSCFHWPLPWGPVSSCARINLSPILGQPTAPNSNSQFFTLRFRPLPLAASCALPLIRCSPSSTKRLQAWMPPAAWWWH